MVRYKDEIARNITQQDLDMAKRKPMKPHDIGSRFNVGYESPRYVPKITEMHNKGKLGTGPGTYEVRGMHHKGKLYGGSTAWYVMNAILASSIFTHSATFQC